MPITEGEMHATIADVGEAGRLLVEAQRTVAWSLKPDGSFVTLLDRQIEDLLRERLLRRFPGWAFIGEESAPSSVPADAARPRVILDPIDGTAAYARGLNFYAIALALVDEAGQPVFGILHLPGMGRGFAAVWGATGPALYALSASPSSGLDVRPLPTRPAASPVLSRDAYLWLGSDPHQQIGLGRWDGKVRALGATAAHLALLLDDTIDPIAAIVTRYKIWDVAAGLALAEAAGFEARDLRAPDRPLTLAALLADGGQPPFVVARPDVLAALLPAIDLNPPRA